MNGPALYTSLIIYGCYLMNERSGVEDLVARCVYYPRSPIVHPKPAEQIGKAEEVQSLWP